jgi:hypothetical protein
LAGAPYLARTEVGRHGKAQLKPGTRIVSNTFDMGDWKPDTEETLKGEDDDFGGGLSHKFFLWIVPTTR